MTGSYHLIVKFGNTIIPVNPSILRELTIIQDYNKFLPEFRLRLDDTSGAFTHILPFDKNMSEVYIEFAADAETDDKNSFTFDVYERNPTGNRSNPSAEYDAQGLLSMKNVFSPSAIRGFNQSIKNTLETLATSELDVDSTEVSISLDYIKNLIQPSWNNVMFFNYIKKRLAGTNNEYGYKCFVKRYKGKTTFVFKDIEEMLQSTVSHKFVLNDIGYEDNLPVYQYFIYDDYKIQEVFSSKQQEYSYFDYTTGTFTTGVENIENYLSLSDYFLIDQADSTDSNRMDSTGRNSDFTADFKGQVKGSYGTKLTGLVKMWITTQGIPNAVPGQTIRIFFSHGMQGDNIYAYQYSGYWLIERVVHNFGDTYLTKLLLTRHGLDTDKKTTLLKATKRKR